MGVRSLEHLRKLDLGDLERKLEENEDELDEQTRQLLSHESIEQFCNSMADGVLGLCEKRIGRDEHLMFLSHYKVEAGTEAALMRNELEQMVNADKGSPAAKP